MTYKTAVELWGALSQADPGEARAALLKYRANRKLIMNSGSFVVFSKGKIQKNAQSFEDKLSGIKILQTQRLSHKDGHVLFDGKGTFGGLSERTNPDEQLMANISISLSMADLEGQTIDEITRSAFQQQLERLIALRDDLKLSPDGAIQSVSDMREIANASAARESMEEFLELVSGDDLHKKLRIKKEQLRFVFEKASLIPIPLSRVKDDNYVINIWDGNLNNPAYAITPFGHLIDLETADFDEITSIGTQHMQGGLAILENNPESRELAGREILGVESVSVFDALKQWDKRDANGERDLFHDYRYPHEWISVWRKAQTALGLNHGSTSGGLGYRKTMMVELMREVQNSIIDDAERNGIQPHKIDLIDALTQMNGGRLNDISELEGFEEDFDLPHGTFSAMQEEAAQIIWDRRYLVNSDAQIALEGFEI
jgi:hypothetical protein